MADEEGRSDGGGAGRRGGTRPQRIRAFLSGSGWTAGLAGACLFVPLLADRAGGHALHALAGWVYGLCLRFLLRLFRVRGWGLPLAGALAGPVPLVLVASALGADRVDPGARWLAWGVGALFGVVLGGLEQARGDP